MDPKLRKEVEDYMRACEHLIGFVRRYDGLMTNEKDEKLGKEVREFVRVCERLIEFARKAKPFCTTPKI